VNNEQRTDRTDRDSEHGVRTICRRGHRVSEPALRSLETDPEMKHVHPSTRRAIIRQYEREQEILIFIRGMVMFKNSIAGFRNCHTLLSGQKPKELVIYLDEIWRSE
jgi:hypothetical protein